MRAPRVGQSSTPSIMQRNIWNTLLTAGMSILVTLTDMTEIYDQMATIWAYEDMTEEDQWKFKKKRDAMALA